jgi:hypothetical protein
MLRSDIGLLAAALVAAAAACSASDGGAPTPAPDPTPDGGASIVDGGGTEAAADADAAREPAVFLDPSAYADLVVVDASLPFGVTRKIAADDAIAGSHWGRHGGPMVTTGVYGASGAPVVSRWTLPDGAQGVATHADLTFATASGLPAAHFYGADGMVDLPFATPLALLSYSGSGAAFPGEALLYSATYDAVTSRANVNGFYSGAGVADGTRALLVYSGLSPLATAPASTNDNGLYVAEVCDGRLAAPAPCPAARQLVAWKGASGPVVTDAHGNAFVGASLAGAATTDAVHGLAKAQLLAGTSGASSVLASVDSGGTSSLAAIAPEAGADGYVFGLGFDDASAVYAAPYVEGAGVLAKGHGPVVPSAIVRAAGAVALSVFADPDGDLWLAVVRGTTGFFLELRRRP